MTERFEGDGATANGFSHRTLPEDEVRVLYEARYMAPPDKRIPNDWRLSAGGIPIPSELRGYACELGGDDRALLRRPHAGAAGRATMET
jgi:hypothetical protein